MPPLGRRELPLPVLPIQHVLHSLRCATMLAYIALTLHNILTNFQFVYSQDGSGQPLSSKVFVGRCTEQITAEDLRNYFSQFGEVTDVFIPKPFRAFGFVTFLDPNVAVALCGEDHIVRSTSVHVSSAAPKQEHRGPFGRGMGGSGGPSHGLRGDHSGNRSYGGGQGGGGGGWNSQGGSGGGSSNNSRELPNLAALGASLGLSSPSNSNAHDGSGGQVNMGHLTMPMLAALSQASWGLLGGNLANQGGNDQQGGGGGYNPNSGQPSNQVQYNQGGSGGNYGGSGGGNWDQPPQQVQQNWGGQGKTDRYNRYE